MCWRGKSKSWSSILRTVARPRWPMSPTLSWFRKRTPSASSQQRGPKWMKTKKLKSPSSSLLPRTTTRLSTISIKEMIMSKVTISMHRHWVAWGPNCYRQWVNCQSRVAYKLRTRSSLTLQIREIRTRITRGFRRRRSSRVIEACVFYPWKSSCRKMRKKWQARL